MKKVSGSYSQWYCITTYGNSVGNPYVHWRVKTFRDWNLLPIPAIEACTLNSFMQQLRDIYHCNLYYNL